MRNPLRFFVDLMYLPRWVTIWVFYLLAINLASVMFWQEPLAQLVFVTFIVSATLMMGLYAWFGMEKILGLGHVLWIPLLVVLLWRVAGLDGPFQVYIGVLSISLAISLVFDVVDVWTYFRSSTPT